MRRRSPALTLATVALLAAACGPADRNVAEIPDGDTPTPDETPIIEPVTPNPANEAEIPNDGFPPDEGAREVDS